MSSRTWPAEVAVTTDRVTGVKVRRLTGYKGHSHHLYFTNPGWYAGGSKLLFGSDRDNRTNLFSIDLATFEITQLTDLQPRTEPRETSFLFTSVNPLRDEAYFWYGRELVALDLDTLAMRTLYELPDGYLCNMTNCTADGRYVCTGIFEDLSKRFPMDLLHGYIGFTQMFEANPHSQIIKAATDGSGAQVVHEERSWIGHVNTSPTQAHVLSFCHEGPWNRVDNRIWGLDLNTGKAWKIRPCDTGDYVGHEYWFADGLNIGYHGHVGGKPVFGKIRHDNTDLVEVPFPHDSQHFHSNDLDLIVGDGTSQRPQILLWRYRDGAFDGPRVLCEHRCSRHSQQTHVHPRLSPDGESVLYTSDATGYGQVYVVDIPPFESLPQCE